VGGDADHLARVDARVPDRGGNGRPQRLDVVARVLQRPVWRQLSVTGQLPVDHAVRVLADGRTGLGAVAHPYHQRTRRQRAEVHADNESVPIDTFVSANIHFSALPYIPPTAFLPVPPEPNHRPPPRPRRCQLPPRARPPRPGRRPRTSVSGRAARRWPAR